MMIMMIVMMMMITRDDDDDDDDDGDNDDDKQVAVQFFDFKMIDDRTYTDVVRTQRKNVHSRV